MTLLNYIQELEQKFLNASLTKEEAKRLVSGALEKSSSQILLDSNRILGKEECAKLNALVNRRLQGEPLQYLLGKWPFWKSDFKVGPGVLIPRPETEHLVERLLTKKGNGLKIAELGAGSGNIGISVLLEKDWEWNAFEINPESLPYLKENIALLPPGKSYHLRAQDFFEGAASGAPYDGIVSNPPYIASCEIPGLSKEVQREPHLALDGGETGLELIRKMAKVSFEWLKPGGFLIFEAGFGQKDACLEILEEIGYSELRTTLDLASIPRIFEGTKPWTH